MKHSGARVLILAPHTDDAELGCGGTIARLKAEGTTIRIVAFSRAEDSVPLGNPINMIELEMRTSLLSLGIGDADIVVHDIPVRRFSDCRQKILDLMIVERRSFNPDWVFAPNRYDNHQDHQVICQEAIRAFNSCRLWGYELPWNNTECRLNAFVSLTALHLERKAMALSHYKSQLVLKRPYFTESFVRSLAIIRGLQGRMEFAEAFEVMREVV